MIQHNTIVIYKGTGDSEVSDLPPHTAPQGTEHGLVFTAN